MIEPSATEYTDLPALREEVGQLREMLDHQSETEAALRSKLQQFELAAEGANDGLWDWNMVTDEIFVSKAWINMLGFAEGEVAEPSKLWMARMHPHDKLATQQAMDKYLLGITNAYEVEFRLLNKQEEYRWILARGTILKDAEGNPCRISGTHTDITERKMAEQALMQSEQKYRNLFENSLVAMLRADIGSGEILEANGKAWELFCMEPKKGAFLSELFINEEQRESALSALREKKVMENHELEVQTGDGRLLWVSISACYYAQEQMLECVLKDITDTKKTLLELQKVNFELDNFVYHASHDLRSPLRSILGLINLLRIEDNEKAKQNCVDMIEGSIKRLDNLVQDLLSMSRNNRVNDPHVEVHFMNEINYSYANFYHVSDTKNLEIATKVYQPVNFISDVTRIRIILNNLISNSIKYRSYGRERSYIHVDVRVTEEEAVFVIEDNGEGIPLSKQPNIFDMFVRASENSEGSGLGLYIVKNVLEKLKGSVQLESEENKGTKFTVRIPNNLHAIEEQPSS